jgi:exonuclease VII small subunit
MTAQEAIKLAKVQQKVDDLVKNMDKGFSDTNKQLEAIVARMDKREEKFYTRMEGRAVSAFLGVVLTIVTLYVLLTNKG